MKLFLLILGLLFSAFFSGTETAFVSVTLIEAEVWLKKKLRGARWAYYFLSHPDRYLITVLIGNNIGIVAFSSLSTYFLSPYLSYLAILLFNSAFILVFGEILPKTILREVARKVVRVLAYPLLFFRILFYPLYLFLALMTSLIMKLLGQERMNLRNFFSRQDLEMLLRQGVSKGVVSAGERKIISRVFRFSNRRVRDVLVPRTEMVCLPVTASVKDARELVARTGFSRIPVYGKNLDDIQGILYAKDLLLKPRSIREILREAMFVPQSVLCADLLKQMRARHVTIAIAIDEFGGTAGLVTLEDIVEELFGEIRDEFDEKAVQIRRLSSGDILASGRAEVEQINELARWQLPTGNYETIGGLILNVLGRIPRAGEKIRVDGYLIHILRADSRRVRFVKIHPLQKSGDKGTARSGKSRVPKKTGQEQAE